MMNSNMGMAIVCMINSTEFADNSTDDFEGAEKMNWSPEQQVAKATSRPQ